jgi:omega-hydroxy-beta-dihydromenaquinone-9 sulfotransferase
MMDRDPIAFLVGAGRSGTTLLYKLLSLHPAVAYVSNYDVRLPWLAPRLVARTAAARPAAKVGAWFNSSGNAYFVRRPWLKRFFPTPVEGEALYARCGMPLIPTTEFRLDGRSSERLRRSFARIRRNAGAAIVLSKRTANNRRLPQLDAVFPSARYVHLIRDGREVADSLARVEWWSGHTLWWDGRTAAEVEQSGQDRLTICARNWVREMQELEAGLAAIDAGRVLEVRFEHLLASPLAELGRILEFLRVPATDEYRRTVESLQLGQRSGAWSRWSPAELENVLAEERPLLEQLGYL